MLKIIPLIIIPLFFFIIFLGVENLTQISDEKKENLLSNLENKQNELPNDSSFKEPKNIVNNGVEVKNIEKSDESSEKSSKNLEVTNKDSSLESKEVKTKGKELKNIGDLKKGQKTKTEENTLSPKVAEKSKKIKTQFGAFSKKSYANSSKQSIEKKIKKKFPSFSIKINFDKKKNLYRLIYFCDDLNLANQICEFSKKNKIGCLILK